MHTHIRTANRPSPRLTQSRLSEVQWERFVHKQQVDGYGWAINPVAGFRHLLPPAMQTNDAAAIAAAKLAVDAAADGQGRGRAADDMQMKQQEPAEILTDSDNLS
jgi:hypothetical protein